MFTAAPIPNGCVSYQVIASDTCWAIANRFMITVTQLQMNNPTVNCAFLQVGSNICVQGAPKTTSFAPAYTSAAPAGCTRAYTVVSGDSCLRIATIFGTTFDHLRRCNPIINTACSNLAVGQIITY
jgi:LysM repeat protein